MIAEYIGNNQFRVEENYTVEFKIGRRIKADCGINGYKYSTVLSSSYSSPYTTVTILDDALTSNLVSVLYGIINVGEEGSLPNHTHDVSEGQGGVLPYIGIPELNTCSGVLQVQINDKPDNIVVVDKEDLSGGLVTEIWGKNTGDIFPSFMEDTYISVSSPSSNFSSENILYFAKATYTDYRKSLFKFYIKDSIGVKNITSAIFKLYCTDAGTSTVNIHRVLKNWTLGEATYNDYKFNTTWNSAGCNAGTSVPVDDSTTYDYYNQAVCTSSSVALNEWFTMDITSIVQDWSQGVHNEYGIVLVGSSNDYSVSAATSNEGADGFRPKLEISYYTDASIDIETLLDGQIAVTSGEFYNMYTLNKVEAKWVVNDGNKYQSVSDLPTNSAFIINIGTKAYVVENSLWREWDGTAWQTTGSFLNLTDTPDTYFETKGRVACSTGSGVAWVDAIIPDGRQGLLVSFDQDFKYGEYVGLNLDTDIISYTAGVTDITGLISDITVISGTMADRLGICLTPDVGSFDYGVTDDGKARIIFNATNAYISCNEVAPYIAATNKCTMHARVKFPLNLSSTQEGILGVHTNTGANCAIVFWYSDKAVKLYSDTNGTSTGIVVYNDTVDITLVINKASNYMKLFVDGVLIGSNAFSYTINSNYRFSFGQDWDSNTASDFFSGEIIQFARIYNNSLVDSEIMEIIEELNKTQDEVNNTVLVNLRNKVNDTGRWIAYTNTHVLPIRALDSGPKNISGTDNIVIDIYPREFSLSALTEVPTPSGGLFLKRSDDNYSYEWALPDTSAPPTSGVWNYGETTLSGVGDIYCNDIHTASNTVYIGDLKLSSYGNSLLIGNDVVKTTTSGGSSLDIQTFLDLTDTPITYSGHTDELLKVTVSGIEFMKLPPYNMFTAASGLPSGGNPSDVYLNFSTGDVYKYDLVGGASYYETVKFNTTSMTHAASATLNGNVINLSDGSNTTYWQCAINTNQWVSIDIGLTKTIYKVILAGGSDGVDRVVKNFRIEGSVNNTNWDVIYTGITVMAAGPQEFIFPDVSAPYRYWRLYMIDNWGSILQMNRFELYVGHTPDDYLWQIQGNVRTTTFKDLTDTPNTYSGTEGMFAQSTGSGIVWATVSGSGTGASTFIELTDTPSSYSNGKFAQSTASGIVWTTISGLEGAPGATGADGTDGNIWLSGTGAPSSLLGGNNDFYFDEENGDIYVKDVPSTTNILSGGTISSTTPPVTGLSNVLDGNISTFTAVGQAGSYYGQLDNEIKYDLGAGNETIVTSERHYAGYATCHIFTIQGSNNDIDWHILHSGESLYGGWYESGVFTNTTAYRYYRILCTRAGNGFSLAEWQLIGATYVWDKKFNTRGPAGATASGIAFLDLVDTPDVYSTGKFAQSTTSGIVWATVSGGGTGTSYGELELTYASDIVLDFSEYNLQSVILTGNTNFTFTNMTNGKPCVLNVIQDAQGNRSATFQSNIRWPQGVIPTTSSGSGLYDIFTFIQTRGTICGSCSAAFQLGV
jgi:hypothetical protein